MLHLLQVYEDTYDKSLSSALERCSKEKLKKALRALLVPTPEFIASRLKHAMEGWGTNSKNLVRLLAGFDGTQVQWCGGTVAQWRSGAVAQWRRGAVVRYCSRWCR